MILVKICGITNWPDAKAACDAGADMLGFNFYEKSLRRVSTVEAATIRAKLPSGRPGRRALRERQARGNQFASRFCAIHCRATPR